MRNSVKFKKILEKIISQKVGEALSIKDEYLQDINVISLAQALSKNATLTTLNAWYNKIGAAGESAIDQMLTRNRATAQQFLADCRAERLQSVQVMLGESSSEPLCLRTFL